MAWTKLRIDSLANLNCAASSRFVVMPTMFSAWNAVRSSEPGFRASAADLTTLIFLVILTSNPLLK